MHERKIIYRNIASPSGRMIAGATDKGICLLMWQDEQRAERIIDGVKKNHQLPAEPGDSPYLDKLERQLAEYFEGNRQEFDIPLDFAGTDFENSTWKQLLKIPYGQTRSYGQIAAKIGEPNASRAIGRANGANPIAVVIPCHRVIRSGGDLGGYGGGIERKKWLLELESSQMAVFK